MPKKKFKDTTVGKLLLGAAHVINPSLGRVLEGATSAKDALAEITKADIPVEDKIKLQQMMYDHQNKELEEVSKRWQSDMTSDNKLSKSVRPLTLIFIVVSTVLLIFIDSGFINFAVDDEWKELLKMLLITIVAAYFGGRSYEKAKSINK
jgi:cation transport ATPase